jgi:hypothetical protein
MSQTYKIIQFSAPWQGRSGFRRFDLDLETARLSPSKPVKCRKMLRKAVKDIDGMLLRPVWPTRKGLILLNLPEGLKLFSVAGHRIVDPDSPISIDRPDFRCDVTERLIFRKFRFVTDDATLIFQDLSGRLVGPERVATEIFPEEDFSPFARLIHILTDENARDKLLSDLERRRFKYTRWIDPLKTNPRILTQ